MSDKKLVQLEYDKFLRKDDTNGVSPIAVVNPDGSTISGGGGGSNATVTLMGALPAGDNLIGGVTIYGSLAASLGGNVTLNPSPNFIGIVTTVPGAVQSVNDNNGSLTVDWASGATVSIASMPAQTVTVGNVTLNTSPNQIGSVTISHVVSTLAQGNVTLNSSPNFIGLVTIGNTVPVTGTFWQATQPISGNVGLTGNITLSPVQSVLSLASIYGEVKVTNTVPVTGSFYQATQPVSFGNVTLSASPNYIGLVTVANTVPVTGTFYQATQPVSFSNVTLSASPNLIGIVTVGNIPAVTQSGTWTVGLNSNVTLSPVQSLLSLASIYGKVDLGTTSDIRSVLSVASIYGSVGLALGTKFIGLVTAYPGAAFPVTDNSGSLTVDWVSGATVAITSMPNVTLGSNVTLNASNAFVGLATVVIGTEVVPSTLVNGMVSAASGALTQFPANAIRWVTVKASNSNATTAYIGNSTATINNGMFIDPGDSIGVAINNTNALYLVGVGTTEVRFLGGN